MTPEAIRAIMQDEALPPAYFEIVDQRWRALAAIIARAAEQRAAKPWIVAISGAQGSGKSTVCKFLEPLLATFGLSAVTLALDDFYLTRAARADLATRVHPLLATRGVPGTHDIAMLLRTLDALGVPGGPAVAVPRFDKARDDRAPRATWRMLDVCPAVVLVEGWCLGARPVEPAALATPINMLEAEMDADGRWRSFVNAQLAGPYAALFARFDVLVGLIVPDFATVRRHRALQESKLAAPTGADRRMDAAALDRFLSHYERVTLGLVETLPRDADVIVRLGADHAVRSLEEKGAGP